MMLMRIVLRLMPLMKAVRSGFLARADLAIENLALRQQVATLKKENPRPRLTMFDRLFWVWMLRFWAGWKDALIIVKPETVIGWHRRGFRIYWNFISRRGKKKGRPCTDKEIRELIRRMASENPTWGAPRVHGELLKLGFDVSERTVSRYMPKRKPREDQIKKWKRFLKLHAEGIAAMDFFAVPSAMFHVLYVWFVIEHGRRRILHFNVTSYPDSLWVIQQLREAFSYEESPRHFIFDRDAIFSPAVVHAVKSFGTKPARTSYRCPWQNPVAERWVKSCRVEMLDHVVVFGERHLRKLMREYVSYHNEDRSHYSLQDKDTPLSRSIQRRPSPSAKVIALPRVSGLHHRYEWKEAA